MGEVPTYDGAETRIAATMMMDEKSVISVCSLKGSVVNAYVLICRRLCSYSTSSILLDKYLSTAVYRISDAQVHV